MNNKPPLNDLIVAAVQFASTTDVKANLDTCLRMIDRAAASSPHIMVLPEFCNHLSWYDDQDHAWQVAVELDGEFLGAVAAKAAEHSSYIVINVSLRREHPDITVSSILFDPNGQCIEVADKQTLMGHENDYFVRASATSNVVDTPFGKLGLFPCRDGVTCETPRSLALRGAQLFCDSLNSFALDEASLHVPARAPENKVFLVAANKIGPLIPEALLEPVSEATHIPVKFLIGAGESQIVAPDGTVLAKGPRDEEAVVLATINLSDSDDKRRPDRTDLFAERRPELYQAITKPPLAAYQAPAASSIDVAIYEPKQDGAEAIDEVVQILESETTASLLVLPELFCFADAVVNDTQSAEALSAKAIAAIQQALSGSTVVVATSLVHQGQLAALLIDSSGVIHAQPQLHRTKRHAWSNLGDGLQTCDLPWGRVAIITGDDSVFPELVKVAALESVHTLIVPFDIQERWEAEFGLLSRAAENRLCVVAATRSKSIGTGLIATLERDFTILTPWHQRQFDGMINNPLVTTQVTGGGLTRAVIHPDAANNKLMSANTDLLVHRPWQLSGDLVDTKQFG